MSSFFWSPKGRGTDKETSKTRKPQLDLVIPQAGGKKGQGDDDDDDGDDGDDDAAKKLAEQARLLAEKAVEKEAMLEEKAKKRRKLDVDPQGQEFRDAVRHYRSALAQPDKTINRILHDNFTRHERSLLIPADKERNRVLYKMQQNNRRRYSDMLDSKRWLSWAPKSDLAFKFAFLHFGLPVGPMTMDSSQHFRRFGNESDEDEDDEDHGLEDNPPPGGYLRFLNSYKERSHGYDRVKRPDAVLERYYAFTGLDKLGNRVHPYRARGYDGSLSLRGGGGDEDWDSQDEEYVEEADFVEGPSNGHEELLGDYDEALVALGEPSTRWGRDVTVVSRLTVDKNTGNEVMPLYGVQGMVWFDLAHAETFVDAVDRLLCLGTRAGVRYNLDVYQRGVDYSKASEQKAWRKEYAQNHVEVTCGGDGDYSTDVLALAHIRLVLGQTYKTAALFISTPEHEPDFTFVPRQEENMVYFMAKPDGSPYKRPDVAYFRMPDPAPRVLCANLYEPWLRHCMRILTPGHVWRRPGRPEVPDSFFQVGHQEDDSEFAANKWSSYGGLSFGSFAWNVIKGSVGNLCWVTERRFLSQPDEKIEDWKILLPGLSFRPFCDEEHDKWWLKQHVTREELEDGRLLYNALARVVHAYVEPGSASAVSGVDVWINGLDYVNHQCDHHTTGKVVMPYQDDVHEIKDGQSTDPRATRILKQMQPLIKTMAAYRQWRNTPSRQGLHPAFLAIRPRYKEYKLAQQEKTNRSVACQEFGSMTLADFWKHVEGLYGPGSQWRFRPGKTSVTVTARTLDDSSVTDTAIAIRRNKPTYLVAANTTEEAWHELRNKFSDNVLSVAVLPDSGEVELASQSGLPYGYYDVYAQTDAQLYGVDAQGRPKRHRPKHVRFYDWHWHQPERAFDDLAGPAPARLTARDILKHHVDEAVLLDNATGGKSLQANMAVPQPGAQKPTTATSTDRVMTSQQRGQFLREYSFGTPLSIYYQNLNEIPINAPPVESIYDSGCDSLFKASLGILTPSETRRLQESHYEMRNVALDRALRKPETDSLDRQSKRASKLIPSAKARQTLALVGSEDMKRMRRVLVKIVEDLDGALEKLANDMAPTTTPKPAGADLGATAKLSALLSALIEKDAAQHDNEDESETYSIVPDVKSKANARKRATPSGEESSAPAKRARLSPTKSRTPAVSTAALRSPSRPRAAETVRFADDEDRDALQVPRTRIGTTPALKPRGTRAQTTSPAKASPVKTPGGRTRTLRSQSPEKSPEKGVRKSNRK